MSNTATHDGVTANGDRPDVPIEIWLGMDTLTIDEAKATSLNLLSAVAVAENAR